MKIRTKKYEYILFERRRISDPTDDYVYPSMWRLLRYRRETMRVYAATLPRGLASAKICAIKHLKAEAQKRYGKISLQHAKEIVEGWIDWRKR